MVGRGHYFTTLSGLTEVKYPNAYGWPTMYHHSLRRVRVGRGWLARQARIGWRETDAGGLRCYAQCLCTHLHGYRVARALSACNARDLWLVSDPATDWAYHARQADAPTPRAAVREAVHARRAQRRADQMRERELATLAGIEITIADSIRAGNCPTGTTEMVRRLQDAVSVTPDGVSISAAALLRARDDEYTRRAVAVAMGS